jgi:hypothetical protein
MPQPDKTIHPLDFAAQAAAEAYGKIDHSAIVWDNLHETGKDAWREVARITVRAFNTQRMFYEGPINFYGETPHA